MPDDPASLDVAAIALVHRPRSNGAGCLGCDIYFDTCDVQRLLAALAAAEQRAARLADQLERARQHLQTYHGSACRYFEEALPLPEDMCDE